MQRINRALVSVSDKTGIVEFCRELAGLGIEILSTGGTAALLSQNGLKVTEVSAYTGFPEIMDVGGPAMLRSAAKNHVWVGVAVDAQDYPAIVQELREGEGRLSDATRFRLARKVFAHTANYDAAVANYLGACGQEENRGMYPETYTVQFHKLQDLRYGENPHQTAAFYRERDPASGPLAAARHV